MTDKETNLFVSQLAQLEEKKQVILSACAGKNIQDIDTESLRIFFALPVPQDCQDLLPYLFVASMFHGSTNTSKGNIGDSLFYARRVKYNAYPINSFKKCLQLTYPDILPHLRSVVYYIKESNVSINWYCLLHSLVNWHTQEKSIKSSWEYGFYKRKK